MAIPMTKKGFMNLQTQVDELVSQIPAMQKAISEAREKGDLKENAEYHAARELFGMTEAKIADLQNRLGQASIVSNANRIHDEVSMGAFVKVMDLKFKDEEEYQLVGMGEADLSQNKILTTSPMAQAMMNKKVGEEFTVDAPAGKITFRVLHIRYNDED